MEVTFVWRKLIGGSYNFMDAIFSVEAKLFILKIDVKKIN